MSTGAHQVFCVGIQDFTGGFPGIDRLGATRRDFLMEIFPFTHIKESSSFHDFEDTGRAILLWDTRGIIKYACPEIVNYLSADFWEIINQSISGLFPEL